MTVVIIQARMGSSRLPGKILKKINDLSLLQIQYERIKHSQLIHAIVVATTLNKEDDIVEKFCMDNNILCYRGSDWDVLDRFYKAAEFYSARNVVRITSDCPLHHHDVIDFAVQHFLDSGVDYFSNSNFEPDYLEDGIDVEVFSFHALKIAWNEAKLMSEREHVTPYIKKSGKFNCKWKKYAKEYQFKLSVDTINDFKLVELIANSFNPDIHFSVKDIIKLLNTKPEFLLVNNESKINEGYKKSLLNDRTID